MKFDRRTLLRAGFGASFAAALEAAPRHYNLRYAPRVGWLTELPVPDQLQIYADWGFRAFEYNGLPRHSNAEIAAIRKKIDQNNMAMGVFVVNSGGWKGEAMVDPKFHAGFLTDVKRAVEIHGIVGNECATPTGGLSVNYLPLEQQTKNCIEVMKRAGEMVEKTSMALVLEPLNIRVDHAGYHVVFSDHARQIMEAVNHSKGQILFDLYHQQISEGNLIGHFTKHWDWIAYFQVGDVPGRKEPGTGEVNWGSVFKAIHAKGYQGILGMEHGLSVPGDAGVRKCFEAYRRADQFA